MRVIIAEDTPIYGDGLRQGLVAQGVDVVGIAGTVDVLMELITVALPDVITLDLSMPRRVGSDTEHGVGVEVARTIRATHPSIGLLVVSQYSEPPWVEKILKLGPGTGYLLKEHLDIPTLVAAIHAVTGGGTYVDEAVVAKLDERKRLNDRMDQLTERERDVCTLIAEGLTNMGIGRRLYVSESTVERHERQIYEKLGIAMPPGGDDAERRNRRVLAVIAYLRWGNRP